MELLECGTKATTVLNDIEGIITGITIRGKTITYEFSYFLNGDRKSIWVEDYEVKAKKEDKRVLKVGFAK